MSAAPRVGGLLVAVLLFCAPASAAAFTLAEAPGSPYSATGQQSASPSQVFLGGAVAGDFNKDGISDLAFVNSTGVPVPNPGESFTVLLGHAQGGLTIAPGSPVGLYSGGIFGSYGPIVSGYFNGDGNLDLAVVDNVHNTLSIFLGDGTGDFRPNGAPIPTSGGAPGAIAVGDFNGDGIMDLAFTSGKQTDVLLGDGSGGFAPAPGTPIISTEYTVSLAAGDFNADGRTDLAVTASSGQLTIYLAADEGGFQEAPGSPWATGASPRSIVATDFNGDGKNDLAILSEGDGDVAVMLGDGSGGFTPAEGSPFTVPAGPGASAASPGMPQSIAAGDFDGNGNMDLAVANFNGSSDNVAILLGDGHGGFSNATGSPFPARGNPRGLAVGDYNGDGRSDLAVANPFEGFVTILQNGGEGPPGPPPSSGTTGAHSPTSTAGTTSNRINGTSGTDLGKTLALIPPGAAPGPPGTPTRAQILALIARQLRLPGNWARLRTAMNSKQSKDFMLSFQAPEAGTAEFGWYAAPSARRRAHNAHAKPVLFAAGKLTFATAATKTLKIGFTGAGAGLFRRRARWIRLTERATFTPSGQLPITAVKTVTLPG